MQTIQLHGVFMSKRVNISSGAKWEKIVGYSRAIRLGNQIFVAGTTAVDENGDLVGKNDPYRQTVQIIGNIEKALTRGGARLSDVVRTRIYVTDISYWEEVGRAHGEFFRDIKPAARLVAISRLVDPEMLVEIEVEAVISEA